MVTPRKPAPRDGIRSTVKKAPVPAGFAGAVRRGAVAGAVARPKPVKAKPRARAAKPALKTPGFMRPGNPGGGRRTRATRGGGGIDLGKFASEVSTNFGRGVDQVAKGLNTSPGIGVIRERSRNIPDSAQSKRNNDALKKALGR